MLKKSITNSFLMQKIQGKTTPCANIFLPLVGIEKKDEIQTAMFGDPID